MTTIRLVKCLKLSGRVIQSNLVKSETILYLKIIDLYVYLDIAESIAYHQNLER